MTDSEGDHDVAFTTSNGTITVTGGVDVKDPVISTQPTGATYTVGATATALSVACSFPTADKDGTLSYQWYKKATNVPTKQNENDKVYQDGEQISDATSATYTPDVTAVGDTYYFCRVTNTRNTQTAIVDSSAVEVVVNKATPSVTAPAAKTDLTYSGSAQELITAGATTGGALQYSTDNTSYSAEIPTGTNAEAYTVYYKVVGNENYNDVAEQSVSVTIAKRAITIKAKDQTVEVNAAVGTNKEQAEITSGELAEGDSLDSVTLTPTATTSVTDNGTITPASAAVKRGDSDVTANYAITYVNGTLTVTPTKATVSAAPTITSGTLTYTGIAQTLASGGTANTGVEFSIDNGTTWSDTCTAKDAATYTIYYRAKAGLPNYSAGDKTELGTKEIGKAGLTVTAKPKTITYGDAPTNDGVEYNGFVNSETESVLGGTLAYDYSYTQYGNVGENYTITPKGLTSDNYNITFTAGTLTVQQKEVGLSWADTSLTYSGSAQAPTATATGLVSSDTIEVAVTVEGEHTNAGSYTATASTLTGGKASNYKLPDTKTTSFTIAPKPITPTVELSKTTSYYTGADQKGSITVTVKDGGTPLTESTDYTLTWKKGNETVTQIINVGTYTAEIVAKTGSNYTFTGTKTATFTMDKAAQTDVTLSAITGVTYGSDKTGVTVGGGSDGADAYSLVLATEGTDKDKTENEYVKLVTDASTGAVTITPKKATETAITVYGKRAGGENFADAYSTGVTFTIAKKTLTASVSAVDSKSYDGETTVTGGTLSLSGVKDGDAVTASGTFAWTSANADTTTVDVSGITLSGTDADNYTVAATLSGATAPNGAAISKATTAWKDGKTPAAVSGLTFNNTEQALVTAGETTTNSTVQYKLDNGSYGAEIPTAKNAGTYTVYYKVDATDNYSAIEESSVTVTIAPMTVGIAWVVKDGETTKVSSDNKYEFTETADGYTVTAQPVNSAGAAIENVSIKVKKSGGETAAASVNVKDVGSYTLEAAEIAVTGSAVAGNYQLPQTKTTAIEITPAEVTVTWKIGDTTTTTGTYTGSEQTVTAVVMNGETDVSSKFKFTDEAGVSKAVTNAGKYSFKVEAKEDADKTNYTLPTNATQEITIEKADRTLTATFDGKIKGVDATGSITLAVTSTAAGSGVETDAQNCDLTVTASPTGIVALPDADKFNASYQVTGKKTGATELTFSLAASDNYEAATAKLKVTVDAGYTITVGGITGGSVKPDVTAAAKGTDVTLTVTPSTGYVISSVSYTPEGGSAQTVELADDVYKFTMPENDVTVNATFTKKSSEVAIAGGLPDDVTLEATGGVASNKAEYGATVTVTVSGDKKGNVTKVFWYKTGDTSNTKYDLTKGTDNTYTFQMPDYAVTVGAEAKTPVTLTVTTPAAADGTLSTSPAAGTILPGTEVTVTATPASGKTSGGVTFVKTGDSSAAPEKATPTTTTNNYTFTMPEYDVTVSASFVSTSDINNAASAVEENSVKTGKVDGETEVATSAVESQVDAETLEDIKTAAAKVDVTNDVAVKAEATAPNAAGDKADAVQKLAEAGLVTVDTSGGSTPVVKNGNETATIRIINKVFLDVEVKAFTESGDNMSMKLDIKPMQQKIATVASESTPLNENNTVPLEEKQNVTVPDGTSITLSIGIPSVMLAKAQKEGNNPFVFIKHTKTTGQVYLYKAFVTNGVATFTNTHGFSDFEVELQDSSVASYKYSDTETRYFTTFEAAVADALAKGKTAVTLHKNPENTDKADISEAVDLTVSKASGAVSITYSELYENNFTLGAKIGRGSTAADINDGKLKFAAKYTVTISGDDSVAVGSTLTLTATVEDALGKNVDASSVTWTSSNTDVATVANDGKVTGVASGNVTITATYTDSGQNYTATKTITVTAANGGGTTTTGGGGGGGTVTAPVSMASGVRNGSVSFSNANAKAGEKVTVTPKPNNGYVTDSIVVKDDKGNEIPVTKNADGTFTFTMPASGKVTVTPTFVEESKPSASKFTDVDSGAYYADAVEWAVENGVTTGMSDATFAPEASCTRGQMVTFLWRAAGMPEPKSMNTDFADLGGTDVYYYKAVLWAVEQGITNGTGANRFSPDAIVNRGQVVTFLYRYEKASADARSAFADVNSSAYYAAAVNWAVVNGVTNGTGANKFSPDANCTRGQIVTFLYRDFVK